MVVPHVPPQDIFPGMKTFSVSPANYFDWKAQNDVFAKMTILTGGNLTLTGSGQPESVSTAFVSADFFGVLGVRPLAGRLFAPGDDEPGHRVAVAVGGALEDALRLEPRGRRQHLRRQQPDLHHRRRPAGRPGIPGRNTDLGAPVLHRRREGDPRDPRLPGPGPPEAGRDRRRRAGADGRHLRAPRRPVSRGRQGLGRHGHPAARGPRRRRAARAAGAARRGRLRPPDRLRQRRQPRARQDPGPPQGDRGPRGPRRQPRPHRAPALRGNDASRPARRRPRPRDGELRCEAHRRLPRRRNATGG